MGSDHSGGARRRGREMRLLNAGMRRLNCVCLTTHALGADRVLE